MQTNQESCGGKIGDLRNGGMQNTGQFGSKMGKKGRVDVKLVLNWG